MKLYIALAIFYVICIILEKTVFKKVNSKVWTLFLILPLFCITAFKSIDVGSDTYPYKRMYDIFSQQALLSKDTLGIEIGYVFINRLLGLLNLSFFKIQIIYSIFVYYALTKFISKYSKNIAFSIYFYVIFRFLFFTMSGMRQTIAISILLLSVSLIEKRQFLKFITCVILATSIHSTAIVFIFLYFIPFEKLNFKNMFKIIIVGFSALISSNFLINFFLLLLPKYDVYSNRIEIYDGNFVYIQMLVILSFIGLGIIIESINNKQFSKENEALVTINRISLNAIVIAFIFSLFALNINIASRIGRYFNMFIMIYLPNVIETIENSKLKVLIYYCIIILGLIYYITIMKLKPEWEGVIPFRWMWNNF